MPNSLLKPQLNTTQILQICNLEAAFCNRNLKQTGSVLPLPLLAFHWLEPRRSIRWSAPLLFVQGSYISRVDFPPVLELPVLGDILPCTSNKIPMFLPFVRYLLILQENMIYGVVLL
jgi:hypothetical protein